MGAFRPWESEEDRKRKDDRRYTNRSSQFIRSLFQKSFARIPKRERKQISGCDPDTNEKNFSGLVELETDAYNAFFRGGLLDSVVKDSSEYYPEYTANAKILDEVFKIGRVQDMLRKTVGNTTTSMLATRQIRHMLDELSEEMKESINEAHEKSKDARELKEKLQQMRDAYKAGKEAGVSQETLDKFVKQGQQAREDAVDAAQAAEDAIKRMQQKMDGTDGEGDGQGNQQDQQKRRGITSSKLEKGMDYGKKEQLDKDIDGAISSQDFLKKNSEQEARERGKKVEAGSGRGVDPGATVEDTIEGIAECAALATFLSDSHYARQTLFDVVGRMTDIYQNVKPTTTPSKFGEVIDIKMGRSLKNLTAMERMRFFDDDPVVQEDFERRFYSGALMNWNKEFRVPQGKGPVIFVMDTSGSMESGGGQIEARTWSVALAFALHNVCIERKQPMCAFQFSTEAKTVGHFDCDGSLKDLKKITQWVRVFDSGGTEYDVVFPKLLELLEDDKNGDYKKADVVFVSDGQCKDSIENTKPYTDFRRDYPEVKVLGFQIADGSDGYYTSDFKFCDALWRLDRTLPKDRTEEALAEMFRQISTFGDNEKEDREAVAAVKGV